MGKAEEKRKSLETDWTGVGRYVLSARVTRRLVRWAEANLRASLTRLC
jgi:hypothetical protein